MNWLIEVMKIIFFNPIHPCGLLAAFKHPVLKYIFVSWDDEIPKMMETRRNVAAVTAMMKFPIDGCIPNKSSKPPTRRMSRL